MRHSVDIHIRSNTTHQVTVSVASVTGPLDGVRVSYLGRTAQTYRVESVGNLPDGALENATHLSVLGDDVSTSNTIFDSATEVGETRPNVPAEARFVVSAFPENRTGPTYEPQVIKCEDNSRVTQLDVVVTNDSIQYGSGCLLND